MIAYPWHCLRRAMPHHPRTMRPTIRGPIFAPGGRLLRSWSIWREKIIAAKRGERSKYLIQGTQRRGCSGGKREGNSVGRGREGGGTKVVGRRRAVLSFRAMGFQMCEGELRTTIVPKTPMAARAGVQGAALGAMHWTAVCQRIRKGPFFPRGIPNRPGEGARGLPDIQLGAPVVFPAICKSWPNGVDGESPGEGLLLVSAPLFH